MHQRFAFVATDLYSKWPEVSLCGSVTSHKVIEFMDSLQSRWGIPVSVTTDNGPQFTSGIFKEYLAERNMRHIRIPQYSAQNNGQVERFMRVLRNGIR